VLSEALETLLLLLSPMAPHICDELWSALGREGFLLNQPWPAWDPEVARAEEVTIVVQVNGKVRDRLVVPADLPGDQVEALALASDRVKAHTEGKAIRKVVVVPGRLVNIVVA
jgi:leucyl-tRNA synthetase